MDKRHYDLLKARLEDVMLNGCSHITRTELAYWYGKEKIAARAYRDLEAEWQALTEGQFGRLMMTNKIEKLNGQTRGKGGFYIFAEKDLAPVCSEAAE